MIQALPIVIAPTRCRQTRREKEGGGRVALSFWRIHDNFELFRVRDGLQQRLTSIIMHVIYPREKFLLLWRVAISAFNAYFLRSIFLHVWYVWIIRESITYILVYIGGINRANRAALLLHVDSQFLYLDNQWWAHLRQCSTALLDGKVRA